MFVLNCVDGCIPSDLATGSSDEIEEERRLLYVAMTRARDALTLIVPQRFYVHGQAKNGDRYVSAARTRFIPSPLLKHFDRVAWPRAAAERRAAIRRRPESRPRRAHAGDVEVTARRAQVGSSGVVIADAEAEAIADSGIAASRFSLDCFAVARNDG